VFKTVIGSLLAFFLVMALPACSKQGGTTPQAAPVAAQDATAQAQPAESPAAKPHPLPTEVPDAKVDTAGIVKADGGKTVAELYADKDQLAGKTVTVRGKVVKANAHIMGKSWVHIRDGSGDEKTNDLTVTTAGEAPTVGSTVLVTGTVAVNKDYGMGYQYVVIIEDATVKVE
jgi:hypothetical protein